MSLRVVSLVLSVTSFSATWLKDLTHLQSLETMRNGNSQMWLWLLLCSSVNGLLVENGEKTSLAELPLQKLLHVKQAIDSANDTPDDEVTVETDTEPVTGHLKSDRPRPNRREDWADDWKEGSKKGDVSKIFQSTITILSFLAFGGYLLCTVIMAFRNNTGLLTPTTTVAPANLVVGRRKKRATEDEFLLESLMESLERLAEAYTKYHSMKS